MLPSKFYIPGLFLLALGLGNVIVGGMRVSQYEAVLVELSDLNRAPAGEATSALNRIQTLKKSSDRLADRRDRSQAKRDFYLLVIYGGKVLGGLGTILLGISLIAFLRRSRGISDEWNAIVYNPKP